MSNITQISAPPEEPEFKQTYWQYGWEKCKRQPLVPIGALATCVALGAASVALRSGNRKQFNKYLRYRVAAQGITVIAAVAGALLVTNKSEDIAASRARVLTNQLPPDDEPESYAPLGNALASTSSRISSSSAGVVGKSAQTNENIDMNEKENDANSSSLSQSLPSALAPPPPSTSRDKSTVINALRQKAADQKEKRERDRNSNSGPTRKGGYEGDFAGKGWEKRLREVEEEQREVEGKDDQVPA